MKAQKWAGSAAAAIRLVVLPPLFAATLAVQARAWGHTDAYLPTEAIRAAHLAEPLVATSPTIASEDQALVQALAGYGQRSTPEDVSALTAFLLDNPHSGWAPALLTNLGLSYLHEGYFSRALEAFQAAWTGGRDATDLRSRALVDRAVGELARLDASLGRNTELATLFDEIGNRPIAGSATEAVQTAREELSLSERDPRHLFICGPLALQSLLLASGAKPEEVDFLRWYNAGPSGTSLAEVGQLADKAKFAHRLVFRKPGEPVPVPAIVHWKVGHFAAIVGEADGRFHVKDPVFPNQDLWVTQAALDAEASGYFLVPSTASSAVWKEAGQAEAETIWGKGPTSGNPPGSAGSQDPNANPSSGSGPISGSNSSSNTSGSQGQGSQNPDYPPNPNDQQNPPPCPLCSYNIGEATVSLNLSDVPVGYSPPIGPSAKVQIVYNQREDSQPANFSFFNVSAKWTLNWLTYVTDDPSHPGATVSRYLAGGGAFHYAGYQAGTSRFATQGDGSILVLTSQNPITYQRLLGDGSVEVYAQSDGSMSYPRNVFLSKVIDPQGNALTLNYDTQQRLMSLTDATGRQTTFSYGLIFHPLLVTKITDPFGRSAVLTYDSNNRLSSITDVIGLTSSFTYDPNSLVNSLMTPYGTTTFAYTAPGASGPPRFVQVTDPLGLNEREEWLEPAPVPASDPAATVPTGMPLPPINQYLTYRDSFHWDKNAYVLAGCTPTGGCDYTKARDRHFAHDANNTSLKSTTIESVKFPLENRIWFNYPGQTSSYYSGSNGQPVATGRVLDDGTTQLSTAAYDTTGYFKLTQRTDPVGRTTSFSYANHIDLSAVSQITEFGVQQTIAQFSYNYKHRPIFYTDAAGDTTSYDYNAAGQLTSSTDPVGGKNSYQYNATGDLTSIINTNNITATTFTYDAYDRIRTYTDSEGWTATYDYDAADRVKMITYPDNSTDLYTYDKLDLASYKDRLGRTWTYTHDANRRLTKVVDPTGQPTLFGYNGLDEMTSLTDPKGNATSWTYDVEGRLTTKQYADTSTVAYTYENTTSRLKSTLDVLNQTKQYGYAKDDRLTGISYLNALSPTPNVGFSYDSYFPRLLAMTDGSGTTQYSYVPVGSLGALRQLQERAPFANGTIAYTYDELGRLVSRTIGGAGAETFGYDALGRLTSHASDLGQFTLGYLGETGQVTSRQLSGSTLATSWSYLPDSGDRRLASIGNAGLSAGQFSNFQFTTTPENLISSTTETSDSPTVYPSPGTQTASYNNLNQLTDLSGQALTYDANGNLTSDGQRSYIWDAENRLIGITYPGTPGKATAFAYDGLGRRTSIASTPAGGGSATTTSYIWCGSRICQSRDATGARLRSYYDEGEFVPGTPAQSLYYGPDQIGSVRRVFASTVSAPAYTYDPYGVPLQATAPVTDFSYASMFRNADSGLYFTQYRVYDPTAGRWLSRDPLGEIKGENGQANNPSQMFMPNLAPGTIDTSLSYMITAGNDGAQRQEIDVDDLDLYIYVKSNPLSYVDSDGLAFKILGPGGGGRICGVICGGYGCRMDYAPNPGPTKLHFHFGPLDTGGTWGGHRPWYAPWQTYP